MEAKTERELIIQVDGKLNTMATSVERLAGILERLETVKFEAHESRITKLEKFTNQWGGALIAFNIAAIILGILISIFK
jgi:anti-sigma-K factor RskA